MKQKKLDDPRVIAGLFKEAMFYSRPVQVEGADLNGIALITDFHETSGRAKDDPRTIFLTFTDKSGCHAVQSRTAVSIRCHFVNFIGLCCTTVERCDDGQYRAPLPEVLEVINRRKKNRLSPVGGEKIFMPLLIQNSGFHTEGHFTLEDVSAQGWGGLLNLFTKVPIVSGATVSGEWATPSGTIVISGRLVQVQLVEAGPVNGETLYRVGIQSLTNEVTATPIPEKRAAARVNAPMDLSVRSPLNPEHVISMRVSNASATGFAATLVDGSDSELLPAGCGISLEDSTLIASLVGITGSQFRFQFSHGNAQDRIHWLKKLARFQNASTSVSAAVGSELMDLFCESGASAAGYLKVQTPYAQEFSEGLGGHLNNGDWLHRWIERTNSGEIRGHSSAVQIADNLWHIGDMAAMIPQERKQTPGFFPKFLNSFREYCLNSSPCPELILGYTVGHPMWRGFEDFLRSQAPGEAFLVTSNYHRFGRLEKQIPDRNEWNADPIRAHQHQRIMRLLNECRHEETMRLLEKFDFSVNTFASPKLAKSLYASGHLLRRQYYLLETDTARFIAMLQSFPLGSSQNRTPDVCWLFPLKTSDLRKQSRENLKLTLHHLCLAHGFTSPGFLEIVDASRESSEPASKLMNWAIHHPTLLEFFKERT